MSRLRVPISSLRSGRLELEAAAARYVARVHRLTRGDVFLAFDPSSAMEAEVRIAEVRRGEVICEVAELRASEKTARESLWLLLGVCKGDRFEFAVREATALGVTDIIPTWCAASAASGGAEAKRAERWRRIAVEGARQSGRGDVPTLHEVTPIGEALERIPPKVVTRLCAWEHAETPVGDVLEPVDPRQGAAWLVGPEGGLTESEARLARDAGFAWVSLGPFVLRTETATIASLAAWRCRADRARQ